MQSGGSEGRGQVDTVRTGDGGIERQARELEAPSLELPRKLVAVATSLAPSYSGVLMPPRDDAQRSRLRVHALSAGIAVPHPLTVESPA